MSETTDHIDRPPHPAEVAKWEAEAAKARAEADKALAEAAFSAAQAAEQEADALQARLKAEEAERKHRESMAGDIHHHVYRFDGSVSADAVKNCIVKTTEWARLDPGCDIEVVFFSPGGAVIPGFALFDHLRHLSRNGHRVTTGATGMAASMAGVLVQAGDHRWMSGESWYMIHRAAFGAAGKTFEIEDEVEWVKRIEARIVNLFTSRSNLTAQKIRKNWDRKDWWIDSDQALEYGLVDEIRGVGE